MAARLTMLLPRLAALVVIWLLAAASLTFAAGSDGLEQSPAQAGAKAERPKALVVPDVRRQTYVFAKGILQDAGFGWRVDGSVEGYAANTVVVQNPAPGTKVVDNGTPTVVLRLERNPDYPERGLPENASRPKGTPVVLLKDWRRAQRAAAETAEAAETAPAETAPAATAPAPPTTTATTEPAPAATTTASLTARSPELPSSPPTRCRCPSAPACWSAASRAPPSLVRGRSTSGSTSTTGSSPARASAGGAATRP